GALSRATSASNDSRPPSQTPSDATTRLNPMFPSRQSSVASRPTRRDESLATSRGGPSRAHSPVSPAVLPGNSIENPTEAPT
ncbi:MAG: hypothetical protein ACKPKO_65880, partial [Candidatus Fonsibacter sp.]